MTTYKVKLNGKNYFVYEKFDFTKNVCEADVFMENMQAPSDKEAIAVMNLYIEHKNS